MHGLWKQPAFRLLLSSRITARFQSNVAAVEDTSKSLPLIALPSSFRAKKTRIQNIIESKATDYPKTKAKVLKNRARKALNLPKITMLQRSKYVGPRTVFMDRLLATQDLATKRLQEQYSIADPAAPLPELHSELLKDAPDTVKHILSLSMATKGDIYDTRKERIIRDLQAHPTDTSSPEVVIGVMTNKAVQLAEHLRNNRHDYHAQKLLIQTIQRRRRMLAYLKRQSLVRYFAIIKKLGITLTDLV